VRFIRDLLFAILAGLVIALIVASTGQHHLVTILWEALGATGAALVLILLLDWKRPWQRWSLLARPTPGQIEDAGETLGKELAVGLEVSRKALAQVVATGRLVSSAPESRSVAPSLRFGQPVIEARLFAAKNPPFWPTVASIPVLNDPPSPTVDAQAVEVRATLTFYARQQELYRTSGGWGEKADDPTNRTFPPNGQIELLGVAARFGYRPESHAINADAPRTETALASHLPLRDAEHHIHVHLRGSNTETEGWFLLRNHSDTGQPGVQLQLAQIEPPPWAAGKGEPDPSTAEVQPGPARGFSSRSAAWETSGAGSV